MSSSGNPRLEDHRIPLEEILSATKDFSKETLIEKRDFCKVYKGQFGERLQNRTAAVKRYDSDGNRLKEDFLNELNLISKFNHENIISFIGYCDEGDEMIIVSEYAINGHLGDHLRDHNKRLSMTWTQRLKICLGAAKAFNYLHFGLSEDYFVIHTNIGHAILLDENMEPKIFGFRSSIEVGRMQQHIYRKDVAGDYTDPVYEESGILNKEADVYTFGVVMFELLCGAQAGIPMNNGGDESQMLINLVRRYYDIDGLNQLIDPQIRDQTVQRSLDTFKEIAYRCISYNINDRPSMDRIVKRITEASDIHNHAAASTITIRSHLHENLENLLIPLEEIRLATSNFSPENQIGNGEFNRVYKGQLYGRWGNRTAAFKRADPKIYRGEEEFRNELQVMSSLSHEKIIQLIGYCDEDAEMIIIYDYAVNGSLDNYLTDRNERNCLTWAQRVKICIGAAMGLQHLQASQGKDKTLVHRNVNSRKILLNDNMEPLINGSGYLMMVDKNQGNVYARPPSTRSNMDPIYLECRIVKSNIDVYSLGMVLFEMLIGMPAWDTRIMESDEPQPLINLIRRYSYDDGVVKLIDPLIKDQIDIRSFLVFKKVAFKCISLSSKERPSWNRIIKSLEEALHIQEQGDASTIATVHSHHDKKLKEFRIPLEEIRFATGAFSRETWIGKGGFGDVYKGQSSKNCIVAIKRLNTKGCQGNKEFHNELNMMFRFHHKNIINFIGYCDENNEMIIVNKYASNGSLEDYLEDVQKNKRRSLTWIERLRICIGAAQGLDYLHWGLGENNRVIHRDVKSGNILLDDNLEAKLCDFGLSKSGPSNKPQSKLYTKAAGTRFYMDPLYHESGMLQKESDVYSLGVVLFEMLTGMLSYYEMAIEEADEPQFLINLVRRYFDDGLDVLVDPFIKDGMDRRSFHTFKYVAYECISLNSKDRPTIDTIIDRLEEALDFQGFSILESLERDACSNNINDQMKVQYFKEARSEENFAEEMRNSCCEVRSQLQKRSLLMSELVRRVPGEAGASYLKTLRERQKRDEQKLALLKELLFPTRVETHERKIALDKLDDN